MEYYVLAGKLTQGGGASLPLVIVLEKDQDGTYSVVEHRSPKDGSYYALVPAYLR
jgi:hypothetical protein